MSAHRYRAGFGSALAINCLTLFALALPAEVKHAAPAEIWLAPRTDGKAGSGVRNDPYDGAKPEQLDALMNQLAVGTHVHFAAGTYMTRGITLKDRCWYEGSGKNSTIIRLVDDAFPASGPALASVMYNGDGTFHDSIRISDLTLDCNRAGQSLITQGGRGTLNGLSTAAKNARIVRVRVVTPWANPGEGFPLSVWSSGCADGTCRVEIDSCESLNPAGSLTAISAWGGVGSRITGYIRNCLVIDGPESNGFGSGGWKNFRVSGNTCRNVGAGIVMDTWDYENVTIEKNQFRAVKHWGICYNGHGLYRDIVLRENHVEMDAAADWAVLIAEAAASTHIMRNTFIQNSTTRPAFLVGERATGAIEDNVVQETIRSAFWRGGNLRIRRNRAPSGQTVHFPRISRRSTPR